MAVAATYAYFLIFAQFGFLHALTSVLGDGHAWLRPVLGVMGAAGIAGSGLQAGWFRPQRGKGQVVAGFVLAAAAAGLTAVVRTPAGFLVAAALTGLATGGITVGLALLLGRETGAAWLGRSIGLGTGLAYALGNLPGVFHAPPVVQAGWGGLAAGIGGLAVLGFRQRATCAPVVDPAYAPAGVVRWTGVLFALVATDAAIFQTIQQSPALKAATWMDPAQLGMIAAAHLLVAGWAGWAVDRGRLRLVLLIAAGLIAAGAALIFAGAGMMGAPCYVAGVSAYSVGLVYYPARGGRAGVVARVYAVAGWTGSALGILIAVRLGHLPWWGPGLGLALACGWAARGRTRVQ